VRCGSSFQLFPWCGSCDAPVTASLFSRVAARQPWRACRTSNSIE
jgi:hypothetical protein